MKSRVYLAVGLMLCIGAQWLGAQKIQPSLSITYKGDISDLNIGPDAVTSFDTEFSPYRVIDQDVYCYRDHNGTKAILDLRGGTSFSFSVMVEGWRHQMSVSWKPASAPAIAGWDRMSDLERGDYVRAFVARQFAVLASGK